MNGLQLVGYTADLAYLVFDDAADGGQRHRVPVDDDLLATVREVVAKLGAAPLDPPEAAAEAPEPAREHAPGAGPLAALALLAGDGAAGAAVRARHSRLSPREIQARLRAGLTPEHIAREAGVDEDRVLRWLPPIEAEQKRVLAAVQAASMVKPRLGPSSDPVGAAVAANLEAKHVSGDDVEWNVTRGEHDARWSIALRYRHRGRSHRALWRFDPDSGHVAAANDLAVDIAWTRSAATPGPGAGSSPSVGAGPRAGRPDVDAGTAPAPRPAPAPAPDRAPRRRPARSQPPPDANGAEAEAEATRSRDAAPASRAKPRRPEPRPRPENGSAATPPEVEPVVSSRPRTAKGPGSARKRPAAPAQRSAPVPSNEPPAAPAPAAPPRRSRGVQADPSEAPAQVPDIASRTEARKRGRRQPRSPGQGTGSSASPPRT